MSQQNSETSEPQQNPIQSNLDESIKSRDSLFFLIVIFSSLIAQTSKKQRGYNQRTRDEFINFMAQKINEINHDPNDPNLYNSIKEEFQRFMYVTVN